MAARILYQQGDDRHILPQLATPFAVTGSARRHVCQLSLSSMMTATF
jgi:hypothetical protein